MSLFYISAVLFFLIISVLYWILIWSQKRIYKKLRIQGVSCEPFVPLIGQLAEINKAVKKNGLMDYYTKLTEIHGHAFVLGFGPWTRICVMEPEIIADILSRSSSQDFDRISDNGSTLKYLIGMHNLVMTNGYTHVRARKMLNPAFHSVNLPSIGLIMIKQTMKTIDKLHRLSAGKHFIDLQIEFQKLTLSVMVSSGFGDGFNTIPNAEETVSDAFTLVLDAVQYRVLHLIDNIPIICRLPFWQRRTLNKGCRDVSTFMDQVISDRRQGRSSTLSENADLLDFLLSSVDENGKSFSDEEVKDLSMSFVFSGHETTGNLMTWVMYVLMTNEEVWRACRDEVDKILPNGVDPTYEDLSKLVICEAVLHETLRLYPPAPLFTRQCIRDHIINIDGQRQLCIPAGTVVSINTYILHRRADFWPRPNEFDYTRWMRNPVTGLKPKLAHPFCYLPFGAGPRNCIAQNFALMEAKIILAMLVQRCDFELESAQKLAADIRLTMRSKYGLRARVTERLYPTDKNLKN